MKNCPSCGADVEGLTHHCDCCGALLNAATPFFVWHTFVTEASGDLYLLMKELFQRFDGIDFSQYSNILQVIEVNVFCYPTSIIAEQGIKNRLYFSTNRRKAVLTVVLNFDEYISGGRGEKKELFSLELKAGFTRIREKASKLSLGFCKLLDEVIQSFDITI